MQTARFAFEDFHEGMTIDLGSHVMSAEEITAFAADFDPQPMHLDESAGRASLLGGLAASGWHVCSVVMRMMCDRFLLDSTSEGAPGVDFVRWLKPVLAGDTLHGTTTILSVRRSKSNPQRGLVLCRQELVNQRGELVYQSENTGMFLCRTAEAAA